MPNWIVHMGVTFLFFKTIRIKLQDMRLILLGSVFPDATAIAYVLFLDIIKLPGISYETVIWYFQPFHTPFLALFYSIPIALIFSGKFIRNYLLFYTAALFHFLLDTFQTHVGYHQLLAYPFSFKNFNLKFWYTDHIIFFIFTFISLFLIIWTFFIHKNELKFTKKNLRYVIIFTLITLSIPFLTKELFYKNNFHYLNFFSARENYENKEIKISVSKIVNIDPLQAKELNKILTLKYNGKEKLNINDSISFNGIYKNGIVEVSFLKKDKFNRKILTSIIGMLLLFLFFLKNSLKKTLMKS